MGWDLLGGGSRERDGNRRRVECNWVFAFVEREIVERDRERERK